MSCFFSWFVMMKGIKAKQRRKPTSLNIDKPVAPPIPKHMSAANSIPKKAMTVSYLSTNDVSFFSSSITIQSHLGLEDDRCIYPRQSSRRQFL